MSIVHKNISIVNKKSKSEDEKLKRDFNLGIAPSNGKDCNPSFV